MDMDVASDNNSQVVFFLYTTVYSTQDKIIMTINKVRVKISINADKFRLINGRFNGAISLIPIICII